MHPSPEYTFFKEIPGVIPEHPLQYMFDMLRSDRIECSKHTGYSPAATSWMISSASQFHSLSGTIRYHKQRCLDIQTGRAEHFDSETEVQEREKNMVATLRSYHMEYALMKRDFAQERLSEAQTYKWDHAVPYRAAILLELEGILPTIDQVKKQCILDDDTSKEALEYIKNASDYFYRIIFDHVLEKYFGKEILGESTAQKEKLLDFMYTERSKFHEEFQNMMRSKASTIYQKGEREGSLTENEAKILALYISWGGTGDLYGIDEHTLSRHTVHKWHTLTHEQRGKWFPRTLRRLAA